MHYKNNTQLNSVILQNLLLEFTEYVKLTNGITKLLVASPVTCNRSLQHQDWDRESVSPEGMVPEELQPDPNW